MQKNLNNQKGKNLSRKNKWQKLLLMILVCTFFITSFSFNIILALENKLEHTGSYKKIQFTQIESIEDKQKLNNEGNTMKSEDESATVNDRRIENINTVGPNIDNKDNWLLNQETRFNNYLAYDSNIGSILYKKNNSDKNSNSLAFNVMLSLLALEKLGPKYKITINNEIANKSVAENNFSVLLRAGSTYRLEYLLYAVLLYDSKAALEAISSTLAETPIKLINLIKTRARNLGMDDTELIFTRDTYFFITNLNDFSLLLNAAYTNMHFKRIFETRSEVYLSDERDSFYIKNRMNYAWTFSKDSVQGAIMSKTDTYLFTAYLIKGENYSTFILQSINYNMQDSLISFDNLLNQAIIEAFRLSQSIFAHFERTILVTKGAPFRTISLSNRNEANNLESSDTENVQIDLIYLNTVYFLKPVTVTEVNPTTYVQIKNNITLPIRAGTDLGNISFYLPNGERYKVNVGSANDVFSENNSLEKFFSLVSKNSNVVNLIIILLFAVLFVIIIEIIGMIIRFFILQHENRIKR